MKNTIIRCWFYGMATRPVKYKTPICLIRLLL
ncbi:unnamed protein product, partial [marine sediment metagenome]